jgi:DNA-binding SARP family transcriptional activator
MSGSLESGKPVSLRLLGSVDLQSSDGRAVTELLARPKLIGILAYLALDADQRFIRRDKLLALFWPDDDEEHARASLRTALHRIRSALPFDVIRSRGSDEVGVDPALFVCDANRFRACAESGDCRKALDIYAGELLDAFHIDASAEFCAWLEDQRNGLRMLAADCARNLAAQCRASDNPKEALYWSRRLLAISPNDESALRILLTALFQVGETAEAIAMYESFARRYRDEFDLDLSPETNAIIEGIRSGRVEAGQVAAKVNLTAPGTPARPAMRGAGAEASRFRWRPVIAAAGLFFLTALVLWGIRDGSSTHGRSPEWIRAEIPGGPLPRSHHTLVFDPETRQVILFGGASNDAILDDVWRLSLNSDGSARKWQRVRTVAPGPVRRWIHFAAYDSGDDTMIIVAGAVGHTSPCVADVWVLDNAMLGTPPLTWRKIEVTGPAPAPRAEFGAFYDPGNNRLVIHGGHDCIAPVFPDIWMLNLAKSNPAQWVELKPLAPHGAPPPLRSQVMAYDAESNRAIVFGGMDGRSPYGAVALSDLWILTNANGLGGRPEWVRPAFRGQWIPPTSKGMGAYDASTNRLIVFGGYHGRGASSEPTSDIWVLEGANGRAPHANWRKITPRGNTPGPRVSGAVVFDPDTERLIMFGGYSKGKPMGDVWFLTSATGSH